MWSRRLLLQLLIQCDVVLRGIFTWLGTLWNSAVPDLMSELGSVVIHVDHIDHNVNGVFYLVAVQVHCMSPQLRETQTHLDCRVAQAQLCKQHSGQIATQCHP